MLYATVSLYTLIVLGTVNFRLVENALVCVPFVNELSKSAMFSSSRSAR